MKRMDENIRTAALKLLSRRAYATEELRKKLVDKGFDSEEVSILLSEFVQKGFLDDPEYARRFVENKRQYSFLGKRMITAQLKSKGLSSQVIQDTMEAGFSEQDELLLAKEAARRKLVQWKKNLDQEKRRMRLYNYLARKGYANSTIYSVIRELLSGLSDETEDVFDIDD